MRISLADRCVAIVDSRQRRCRRRGNRNEQVPWLLCEHHRVLVEREGYQVDYDIDTGFRFYAGKPRKPPARIINGRRWPWPG